MKLRENISSVILMIIFIVMAIAQCIFYHHDMNTYRSEISYLESTRKDLIWSLIDSTFETVQIGANDKTERIAKSIVQDIKYEYPDLSVLQLMLDQGNIQDTKLPYIIYQNIRGEKLFGLANGNNDCFVLSRDGYIMDSNIARYGRSWHSFKEEVSIDAEEFYRALEMQNGLKGRSLLYTRKSSHSTRDKLLNGSIDDIKTIFYASGIDGLRGLTFFGKSYITEEGDIFGTNDIAPDATRNNNHKLIVVQKFNLYDIISLQHGDDIALNNSTIDKIKLETEKGIVIRSITYLGLMILNIIAMLIIIFWSNINSKFSKK